MWIVCITSVRHVLTVNGYGGRQTKENEKSWCFKGWETLVIFLKTLAKIRKIIYKGITTRLHFLRIYSIQGSTTVKRLPRPSSDWSSMRPPIFSTMSTQMDKPSPTPWENSLRL